MTTAKTRIGVTIGSSSDGGGIYLQSIESTNEGIYEYTATKLHAYVNDEHMVFPLTLTGVSAGDPEWWADYALDSDRRRLVAAWNGDLGILSLYDANSSVYVEYAVGAIEETHIGTRVLLTVEVDLDTANPAPVAAFLNEVPSHIQNVLLDAFGAKASEHLGGYFGALIAGDVKVVGTAK
jgi:hypothetical protein